MARHVDGAGIIKLDAREDAEFNSLRRSGLATPFFMISNSW